MRYAALKFALAAIMAVSMMISTSAAFGVNGVVFSGEVSPGQEILHEISVSNDENDSRQNMTAEVFGFGKTESGVNTAVPPEMDAGLYTARPFLFVDPNNFTLEPGERKILRLTGTVPDDIGSGGRYASVIISPEPKTPEGGNIMISTAIQVLVLLTIKDSDLIKTGVITNISASASDQNVSVDLIFNNTGNVHYKPVIGSTLLDENGNILATHEPAEERESVLPTGSRLIQMTLVPQADLTPGSYTVKATVALSDGRILDSREETFDL